MWDFIVFPAFIYSQLKPPSPHKGPAVFLNIELTHNFIAIAVPPPPPLHENLSKHQEVDNTLLKIEVI